MTSLTVPSVVPSELVVEASPRRVYANAHTYHVNSVSVNSDQLTFLSADDLRINLWHLDITNQSFSILRCHGYRVGVNAAMGLRDLVIVRFRVRVRLGLGLEIKV